MGGGGEGNGEPVFNGERTSVWEDGKSWRWMVAMLLNGVNALNAAELYA